MAYGFPRGLRSFAILNSVAMLIHPNGVPLVYTVSIKVSHLSMVKSWGFDFHKRFFFPLKDPGGWCAFLLLSVVVGIYLLPVSKRASLPEISLGTLFWVLTVCLMQSSRLQLPCLGGCWIITPLKCAHLCLDLLPSGLSLSSLYNNCLGYEFSITEKESHLPSFKLLSIYFWFS